MCNNIMLQHCPTSTDPKGAENMQSVVCTMHDEMWRDYSWPPGYGKFRLEYTDLVHYDIDNVY